MRTPQPRGFILITVLFLIVILTVTAAILVQQSTNQLEVAAAVKTYGVAQARAQMGVMQLRAETRNAIGALLALPVCLPQDAEANNCNACVPAIMPCRINLTNGANPADNALPAGGTVDYTTTGNPITGTSDLGEGGGAQYQAFMFNAGPAAGANGRYFIVSTGYYGNTLVPPATISLRREARVEVEISLPSGVQEKVCPSGVAGSC